MNLYVRKIRMINGLPWLEGKRKKGGKNLSPTSSQLPTPTPLPYLWGVARSFRRIFQSALFKWTDREIEKKKVKRNKRKILPPLRCSFSSFSSTPHYNTAFVVVSASNLHVTRRVEYGERRHWLRGKPVGVASTPHSLSASRGWKRGNTIKKNEREKERQFWRNASLEELQFFVLNFCWKFSSFYPPPLFDSWMLITSLKPTLQGILRFWRSKHGSISLFYFFTPLSLFIYFFYCRNEVANKPVVQSVITNALGIFFFLAETFSSFYMFCIASFSESSKSELITEPVAKASWVIRLSEMVSNATIPSLYKKVDLSPTYFSCHIIFALLNFARSALASPLHFLLFITFIKISLQNLRFSINKLTEIIIIKQRHL